MPLVAKPPAGAGAQDTYLLANVDDFGSWLGAAQADPAEVWLLTEFPTGREPTFDSVIHGGDTLWSSVSDYQTAHHEPPGRSRHRARRLTPPR